MNECSECHQPIPAARTLCDACESDQQAAQDAAGEAERVFKERMARASAVE